MVLGCHCCGVSGRKRDAHCTHRRRRSNASCACPRRLVPHHLTRHCHHPLPPSTAPKASTPALSPTPPFDRCVRPTGGSHDWCAPFSAEALGKVVLKLRPYRAGAMANVQATINFGLSSDSQNSQNIGLPATQIGIDGETLYLMLTVSMNGSQRLLRIKPLTQRQLPYKVDCRSCSPDALLHPDPWP